MKILQAEIRNEIDSEKLVEWNHDYIILEREDTYNTVKEQEIWTEINAIKINHIIDCHYHHIIFYLTFINSKNIKTS